MEIEKTLNNPKTEQPIQTEKINEEPDMSRQKKGRIFIKNLVYDINERMLKKLFRPYGEISDINIPLKASTNKPQGFAFVQFNNKNKALKAINNLNKKKYKGRIIELALAVDQRLYRNQKNIDIPEDLDTGNDVKIENGEVKIENEEVKIENGDSKIENGDFEIEKIENGESKIENEDGEVIKENGNFMEHEVVEGDGIIGENGDIDGGMEIEEENKVFGKREKPRRERRDKKEEDEKTLFIRNICFDTSEQDLLRHFKKYAKVEYLKTVKFAGVEDKHTGSAFLKFRSKSDALKLLNLCKEIEINPEKKSVLDPMNILELSDRKLNILSLLARKDLKKNNDKDKKKKKKKGGKVVLKGLAEDDSKGKKNFKLVLKGLFVSEDNLEIGKPQEVLKRKNHLIEKLIKMQNPNMKVSTTKIVLKNINKKLDKKFFQAFSREVLENEIKLKTLKKLKIFRNINILEETEKAGQSKGIAFLDFSNNTLALQFMNHIIKETFYNQLINEKNEMPIIEFAFENSRKELRRIELIKKLEIINKKQEEEKLVENLTKEVINKKFKKLRALNNKTLAKKNLNEALRKNDEKKARGAFEDIKKLKSRGLKQRLWKKLYKKFPVIFENETMSFLKYLKKDNNKNGNIVVNKKKKISKIQNDDKLTIKKET